MSFDAFLGNEQLKKNLSRSLAAGHISHFYLISGPAGCGKHTLAKLLAAAILCQGEERKPCLTCRACKKVLDGAHPDFITVDDPEKKTVPVDLIREARADMYIQPNESDYKIYLFPRAQDMGLPGQNALLKVLEEPPSYGVFILLADNPNKLLPTVRSRCTELKLLPLTKEAGVPALRREFPQADEKDVEAAFLRSGGYLGVAKNLLSEGEQIPPQTVALLDALCRRDPLALMQVLIPLEKWKRDGLSELVDSWGALSEAALVSRAGLDAVSPGARQLAAAYTSRELVKIQAALQKASLYLKSNVSPGAVCGYLEWELQIAKK